jgi:putative methionine-R-sulfoxide reductase with GAF domain
MVPYPVSLAWATVSVIAGLALGFTLFGPTRLGKDADAVPWLMRLIQVVLIAAGIGGALVHAFPIQIGDSTQDWPHLDLTTIAWLGLMALAVWLPDISEIGWGEFSVKTKRLRRASTVFEKSLDNLANLVQNWSTASTLYICAMNRPQSELLEPKTKTYADYVRDRMGEAYEMLATRRDVTVRLGLWLFDPGKNQIVFAWGYRLKPKTTNYAPGDGMIGKAFVEDRHFNEADVRTVPAYLPSRDGDDPPYRAVLCEPVRWCGKPIGMITVDRSSIGHFDYVSQQVTQGLAAQCALAVRIYIESGGDEP